MRNSVKYPVTKQTKTLHSIELKASCYINETYILTMLFLVAAYESRHINNKVNEIENQEEIEKEKKILTLQLSKGSVISCQL